MTTITAKRRAAATPVNTPTPWSISGNHGRWYADVGEILAHAAKPSRDDDGGDELHHDLLDVLQKNVPPTPPYASARGDSHPLARELRPDFLFHTLSLYPF